MAKFALLGELKAKPGIEAEVEAILEKEASLTKSEPGTVSRHALNMEGEKYGYRIFDTVDDEGALETHLNGEAGRKLAANAERLFSEAPKVFHLQGVAEK